GAPALSMELAQESAPARPGIEIEEDVRRGPRPLDRRDPDLGHFDPLPRFAIRSVCGPFNARSLRRRRISLGIHSRGYEQCEDGCEGEQQRHETPTCESATTPPLFHHPQHRVVAPTSSERHGYESFS